MVIGAGPIGLATAMLLAADGHDVTVLEKDSEATPSSEVEAWDGWRRPGVAQFRQAHLMLPRFRAVLDAELPVVADRLNKMGGRRFSLIDVLPRSSPDTPARAGDERFDVLTGRRPVVEAAFAQVAEETPGVTIRRGVVVDGPLLGSPTEQGIPHVNGVRTSDGVEIKADLVIDAMGRRSKLPEWIAAAGGRPLYEEAADAGFTYYTRHYHSPSGHHPRFRGPPGADVGTIRVLTLPADNDTWTVGIVAVAGDAPLKALRDNQVWERVVRAVPHAAHWLDGEPVTDVIPMAGVLDRYRRIVVDGRPVITGVAAVGDAWACTNPAAGRGMSVGLAHAVLLRDAMRAHPDSPVDFAKAFDDTTEETLTPWYRDQVERDHRRAGRMQALLDGRPPDPDSDPLLQLMGAARSDPDTARGVLDVLSVLALPVDVLKRTGIRETLERVASSSPPPSPPPGPSRDELVALTVA